MELTGECSDRIEVNWLYVLTRGSTFSFLSFFAQSAEPDENDLIPFCCEFSKKPLHDWAKRPEFGFCSDEARMGILNTFASEVRTGESCCFIFF